MDYIDKKERYDIRKISLAAAMFDWIFCPVCGEKMKRVKSQYELHWRCGKCMWVTWYEKEKKDV